MKSHKLHNVGQVTRYGPNQIKISVIICEKTKDGKTRIKLNRHHDVD